MADLPTGWVSLGESRVWQRLMTSPTSTFRTRFLIVDFLVLVAFLFLGRWAFDTFGGVPVAIAVALVVVALVGFVVHAAAKSPPSEVNLDTDEARIGGRVVPFSDITEAVYLPVIRGGRVDSYLSLDTHAAPVLTMCLRSSKVPELSVNERMLVAEVLRRSNVELPHSKRGRTNVFYDPQGKFEWMRHPNHLTKEDAIEYVLHTPRSGEAWRSPPPKKSIWIDEN
jgi:hypothetical protein